MKIIHIAKNIPTTYKEENDIVLRTFSGMAEFMKKDVYFIYPLEFFPSAMFFSKFGKKFEEMVLLPNEFIINDCKVFTFKYIRLPFIRYANCLLDFFSFRSWSYNSKVYSQELNCDVVHCHHVLPDGLLVKALGINAKLKAVTVRQGDVNKLKSLCAKDREYKLYSKVLTNFDVVISPSYSIAKFIESNFSVKVNVIPHPVEDNLFTKSSKSLVSFEKSNNEVTVAISANFIARKNINWVIDAVKSYSGSKKIKLYVSGTGPELESLFESASGVENIIFTGKLSHVDNLDMISKSDLFVLPSEKETFGRVYIEALALGVPCIALAGTGLDGYDLNSTILFVNDRKHFKKVFYEQIESAFSSEYKSKRIRAKDIAKRLFSTEVVYNTYLKLYNQIE